MGSLNWATREGMPRGCGDFSMISSSFPNPTVQDLLDMNALFRRLKKDAVIITIFPIPLARLIGLMFTDASLANRKDCATQCAYIACMTDVAILEGQEAPVSVLAYKSHHIVHICARMCELPFRDHFGSSRCSVLECCLVYLIMEQQQQHPQYAQEHMSLFHAPLTPSR